MSALKKCLSILNKARVDEGLSPQKKAKQRAERNERHYGMAPKKASIKRQGEFSNKDGAIAGKKGEKIFGSPRIAPKGVHPSGTHGVSPAGSAARFATKHKDKPFGDVFKKQALKQHARIQEGMKNIRPKLAKAIEFLEKARVDEGLSHQDKVNARASRHDRVSMLSGKIKGSVSRTKMEQGVHRPTSGKNYGFTESSRLGDMVRRKDGGARLEIKGTHKRLKNIKPKLVKAMQWLEQNDLQKGENDELAFHAERARAAQSANKNAIAKEHFLAFLKLATEQCKIASSIWGMRSLFNKTLDYYLDLADTKIYSSNQGEVSNGTSDSALVIYFKNGGKFEGYKG